MACVRRATIRMVSSKFLNLAPFAAVAISWTSATTRSVCARACINEICRNPGRREGVVTLCQRFGRGPRCGSRSRCGSRGRIGIRIRIRIRDRHPDTGAAPPFRNAKLDVMRQTGNQCTIRHGSLNVLVGLQIGGCIETGIISVRRSVFSSPKN